MPRINLTVTDEELKLLKKRAVHERLASYVRRILFSEGAEAAESRVGIGPYPASRERASDSQAPTKPRTYNDETIEELIARTKKAGLCPHEVKVGRACGFCKGGIAKAG